MAKVQCHECGPRDAENPDGDVVLPTCGLCGGSKFFGMWKNGCMFGEWVVTDVNKEVLGNNWGPQLEAMGARIEIANALELWKTDHTEVPCMVIMSCLFPVVEDQGVLDHCLRKYLRLGNVSSGTRSHYFQALLHDAVVSQMTKSTVVTIVRRGDAVIPGAIPCGLYPMVPVDGYKPKACNMASPRDVPRSISEGQLLSARVSVDGPFDPMAYINGRGYFDLVPMVAAATTLGTRVLFIGEHDGSLAHSLMQIVQNYVIKPGAMDVNPMYCSVDRCREFNGFIGSYEEYYKYNEETSESRAAKEEVELHPQHVQLHTASMWYVAEPVNMERWPVHVRGTMRSIALNSHPRVSPY